MVDVCNTSVKWLQHIIQGEEEIVGSQPSVKAGFLIVIEDEVHTKFGSLESGQRLIERF